MDKAAEKSERIDSVEKHLAWAMKHCNCNWDKHDIEYYSSEEHRTASPDWWWNHREQLRNEYTPRVVPAWSHQHHETEDLYIYITPSDPLKIGYTPNKEYGRADRQIVTTVGRLLTKLKFSEARVRAIVEQHRAAYLDNEVFFAFSADEIQHVYRHGPNSCMSHEENNWRYEYPVRIYDGPDTVVAYLKNGDSITARAVCDISSAPMRVIRAYGDEHLLMSRLQKLGFVNSGDYQKGVRLRRAEARDGWLVCPYVDYCGQAHDDGKFLVLGTGCIDPQTTGGAVPIDGDFNEDPDYDYNCDWCDDGCHETYEARNSRNEQIYICDNCCNDEVGFVHAVVRDNETWGREYAWIRSDNSIEIKSNWYLDNSDLLEACGFRYVDSADEWMYEDHCTYVESCEGYLPNDEVVYPLYRDDPEDVDNCTQGATGDWIHDDDARETNDGRTFHERDTTEFEGRLYHIDEIVEDENGRRFLRQGQLETA